MKKLFLISIFTIVVLITYGQNKALNPVYSVTTPNGSHTCLNNEYPPQYMPSWVVQQILYDENVTYGGLVHRVPGCGPTHHYNCHGYAWHMSNSAAVKNQSIWITYHNNTDDWPQSYWQGGSYTSTSESNNSKAYFNGVYHSAVVHSKYGGGYSYRSKWGSGSLMIHDKNTSPYWAGMVDYYSRPNYYSNDIHTEIVEVENIYIFSWEILQDKKNITGFNIYEIQDENSEIKINKSTIKRKSYEEILKHGESYSFEYDLNESKIYKLEIIYINRTEQVFFNN